MALNLRNKFGYFFRTPLLQYTREQTRHVSAADIGDVEYIADCAAAATLTAITLTANVLRWVKFVAPDRATTLTRLAMEQTVTATGNFKLLLADNIDNHDGWSSYVEALSPNNLLAVSGDIDLTATGLKSYTPGSPIQLRPGGIYWIGIWGDASMTVRSLNVWGSQGLGYGFNQNITTMYQTTLTYGTALGAKAPVINSYSTAGPPALRYRLA